MDDLGEVVDKVACIYKNQCARGGSDYPMVLFPLEGRKIKIKAVVISQEPAAGRVEWVSSKDSNSVEHRLWKEGRSNETPHKLPKQIQKIIGRTYDAYDDTIYWTHALKCIPEEDADIGDEWRYCSPHCINQLHSRS